MRSSLARRLRRSVYGSLVAFDARHGARAPKTGTASAASAPKAQPHGPASPVRPRTRQGG
ncbi:hypothetical protein KPP03845_300073 (plasmid) [Streptomyces xanthophaeus]|uniref:hypothetical protein n=1 Tax=Streptomyces xanthophaeus TaxID=67385 RepID=UPI00233EE36B|nr:hypothetical protein [Streptomyces xanthophaeus]WCD91418.1 hypothetical protein KPP03845_300073 [Streptomyces xanthophaeus]